MMVEKITLIEPHLEGAQFTPEMTEREDEGTEDDGPSSRRLPVVGFLTLLTVGIALGVAARYIRKEEDAGITIEQRTSPISLWSRE